MLKKCGWIADLNTGTSVVILIAVGRAFHFRRLAEKIYALSPNLVLGEVYRTRLSWQNGQRPGIKILVAVFAMLDVLGKVRHQTVLRYDKRPAASAAWCW